MKRIISFAMVLLMSLFCTSCVKNDESQKTIRPQIDQMKSICELATMDCYYHNVAKYTKEDATGTLWWKKDRKFWVEYAGVVTIDIDVSLVNMEVDGENVTITIPSAKVLSCKVDETTLTEDSFVVEKNSAKVEAEHQTEAFKEAQENMQQSASEDTALLVNAQQRAQKLLEGYVKNIGDCVGKEYKIKWVYLEDSGRTEE